MFADIDPAADFQGLVAQAVTILQQQQRLALQILDLDAGFRGERMIVRKSDGEVLLIEFTRLDAVLIRGQRQDSKIDLAFAQPLQERFRLVFRRA